MIAALGYVKEFIASGSGGFAAWLAHAPDWLVVATVITVAVLAFAARALNGFPEWWAKIKLVQGGDPSDLRFVVTKRDEGVEGAPALDPPVPPEIAGLSMDRQRREAA